MTRRNDQPQGSDAWLTLPNVLSFARLGLIPVFAWLVLADRRILATALLAAMGITDYLDGRIARATGQVSKLGTLIDPVADRILVMVAIVVLLVVGDLPLWLGIPVLARDAVISIVFIAASTRGFGGPRVRRVGKLATFFLLTSLPVLVLAGALEWLRWPGLVLFGFGGILYYIAAYRYAHDIRAWLTEQRTPFT